MSDDAASKVTGHDCSLLYEALCRCSDGETLRCLYTEYSERMRNRGAHIWTTGAVFIPLSLSGAVAVTSERKCVLAICSIALIWIWYLISEQMRVELERRRPVCAGLETAMLELEGPLGRYGLTELLTFAQEGQRSVARKLVEYVLPLKRLRLVIALFVTLVWLVLVVIV